MHRTVAIELTSELLGNPVPNAEWCPSCLLPSCMEATYAICVNGRLWSLDRVVWCVECGPTT